MEEVYHNQQKRPPEVASAPEVDEAEDEEVVADEPWCQVQCCCQGGRSRVDLEETCQVRDLENIEDDPVDGDDDSVQGKWGVVVAVLAPDGAAVVAALMGSFEGVVDGGYDQDKPRDGCEDLVGEDGVLAVGRRLAERVCYWTIISSGRRGKLLLWRAYLLASLQLLSDGKVGIIMIEVDKYHSPGSRIVYVH